jgi:hypothetical protein
MEWSCDALQPFGDLQLDPKLKQRRALKQELNESMTEAQATNLPNGTNVAWRQSLFKT